MLGGKIRVFFFSLFFYIPAIVPVLRAVVFVYVFGFASFVSLVLVVLSF